MCDAWEDVEAAVIRTEDLDCLRSYRNFDGTEYFKVAACTGSTSRHFTLPYRTTPRYDTHR